MGSVSDAKHWLKLPRNNLIVNAANENFVVNANGG